MAKHVDAATRRCTSGIAWPRRFLPGAGRIAMRAYAWGMRNNGMGIVASPAVRRQMPRPGSPLPAAVR